MKQSHACSGRVSDTAANTAPPDCDESEWEELELPCPCTDKERTNPAPEAFEKTWHLPPHAAWLAARAWAMGMREPAAEAWLAVVREVPEHHEPIVALALRGWRGPAAHLVTAVESSARPDENARLVLVGFQKRHLIAEQAPALYGWMIRRGASGLAALVETGLDKATKIDGAWKLEGLGSWIS